MSAGRDASFLLLKGAAELRLHRETEAAAPLRIRRLVAVTAAQHQDGFRAVEEAPDFQ